jgi:hypothetical protein
VVRAVAVVYVAVTVTEDPPCLLPPAFKFPTSLSTPPPPVRVWIRPDYAKRTPLNSTPPRDVPTRLTAGTP